MIGHAAHLPDAIEAAVAALAAAEDAVSAYRCAGRYDGARVVVGWPVVSALMWSMPVEMPLIDGKYRAGVLLVVDQDVVGALSA